MDNINPLNNQYNTSPSGITPQQAYQAIVAGIQTGNIPQALVQQAANFALDVHNPGGDQNNLFQLLYNSNFPSIKID